MTNPRHHRKIRARRTATELWHVGIAHRPIHALLTPGAIANAPITWLPPQRDFTFIADPFGIWRNGELTVFVEALDYRIKRGEIHYYRYSSSFELLGTGVALREPFHLSYPTIIEHGGEIYMLPEAHKSGKLTLYRAKHFPDQWEPVGMLLDLPAIDASVIHFQNRWWMFYALPGPEARALRELHIAYADHLTGPWQQHSANPVRDARNSARPGGTPFIHEGALYLPTQDCTTSYGDAVQVLKIDQLTPTEFSASIVTRISPEGLHADYHEGLHTLAACGDVTLIDVKRNHHTKARRWINLQRRLRRFIGQR